MHPHSLPVKSILRFRSVCKPWQKLLSSPEFMKMHFHQFSADPKSQDYIISSYTKSSDHQIVSLISIDCSGKKPRKLNLGDVCKYPTQIVGCCRGLLCMCHKPPSDEIFLWNPALNLSKHIRLSEIDFRDVKQVSVGFGYDDNVGDFKVVRIVDCVEGGHKKVVVEVYSAKSDSWQTIKLSFSFQVLSFTNDNIVNGNPCWRAVVPGENGNWKVSEKCLLRFDVKKLVFRILPLPERTMPSVFGQIKPCLVDWKGSLAAICYRYRKERAESIHIWVFDEGGMIWRLNHTFRLTEMKVDNYMRCSDNGKYIGNCRDGKLQLFDFETKCVKVIEIDEAKMFSFKIYGYSESLVYIEGMKTVVVKKRRKRGGLRRRHPKTYSASKIEGL